MGRCTTPNAGRLEYDSGNSVFRYCNGSAWQRYEGVCSISSITHLAKTAADTTGFQEVSAAAISSDNQLMYTAGLRVTKYQFSAATSAVPVKTGREHRFCRRYAVVTTIGGNDNNAQIRESYEVKVLGNYAISTNVTGTNWKVLAKLGETCAEMPTLAGPAFQLLKPESY